MAKKVYAVRKGKTTGLFYSWDACKAAVSGYSGAEYKGFSSETEARAYLEGTPLGGMETENPGVTAYVDGSYAESIGRYSFGCILLTPEGEVIQESGNGSNPESLAIRNVAGEMLGAMFAVLWAQKNGYHRIEIRYDYEGIEKWAVGTWKAKQDLTQKYARFMQEQRAQIQIEFQKVKAHSGDSYNEAADQLAKKALTEGNGIPRIQRRDTKLSS